MTSWTIGSSPAPLTPRLAAAEEVVLEVPQAIESTIVAIEELLEPPVRFADVEGRHCDEHLLYVEPVLAPVEEDLGDEQVLGSEDRDFVVTERDGARRQPHGVVHRVESEEEINGISAPPEPTLAVAPHRLLGGRPTDTQRFQDSQQIGVL